MHPNSVLILEHRWFHYVKGFVPKKIYKTNLKKNQKIILKGKHLTIVASSYNINEIIFCSKFLKKFQIYIEIIDLRVLRPLNVEPIINSIKNKKLIIFETGNKIYGVGAEIIASILEENQNILDLPPLRIGLPDSPTPHQEVLPKIFIQIQKIL